MNQDNQPEDLLIDRLMTIFAHQDDETFSAGGILAKYPNSIAVSITFDENREFEFSNACKLLQTTPITLKYQKIDQTSRPKIVNDVIDLIRKYKPSQIITHVDFDYHHEHRLTRAIVEQAVEWASHTTSQDIKAHQISSLWAAETTVLIPFPEIYIDITNTNKQRLEAIKVYESQSHKGGDGFYSNFHNTRTKLRGYQAGVEHAEAYLSIPIAKSGSFKPVKYFEKLP